MFCVIDRQVKLSDGGCARRRCNDRDHRRNCVSQLRLLAELLFAETDEARPGAAVKVPSTRSLNRTLEMRVTCNNEFDIGIDVRLAPNERVVLALESECLVFREDELQAQTDSLDVALTLSRLYREPGVEAATRHHESISSSRESALANSTGSAPSRTSFSACSRAERPSS